MDISSSENTLVIGSEGVIGNALCNQLEKTYEVHRISRKNCDYSEPSLKEHAQKMSQFGKFKIIICTIGVLHDDIVKPEKRLNDINPEQLSHYFFVNTILPMMVIKHFSPLLDSKTESCFVCLSAMVGSTSDNQL